MLNVVFSASCQKQIIYYVKTELILFLGNIMEDQSIQGRQPT